MELATLGAALEIQMTEGGTKGYICKYSGQLCAGTLLCHTQDIQTSKHVDWSQILPSFAAMAASLHAQPARWQDAVIGPSLQESAIRHVRCRHRVQSGGVIGFVFGRIMPTCQADDLLIASASPEEALELASQMHTFPTAGDSTSNKITTKEQQQLQQPKAVTMFVNKDTHSNPLSQMLQTEDTPNAAVVMISQQPSGPIYFPVIAVRDIAAGEIITYKRSEPNHMTVIKALMQAIKDPAAQAATPAIQGPASCRSEGTARAATPTPAAGNDLMAEVAAAACTSIQELQSMLDAAVAASSMQQQQQTSGAGEAEHRFQRVNQLLQQAVELLTATDSQAAAVTSGGGPQHLESAAAAADAAVAAVAADRDTPAGVLHPDTPDSEAALLNAADQPLEAAAADKQAEQSAQAAEQQEDAAQAARSEQVPACETAGAGPVSLAAQAETLPLLLAAPAATAAPPAAAALSQGHSHPASQQNAAAAAAAVTSTAHVSSDDSSAAQQDATDQPASTAAAGADQASVAANPGALPTAGAATTKAAGAAAAEHVGAGAASAKRAAEDVTDQMLGTTKQQQQEQPNNKKRKLMEADDSQEDQTADTASQQQQQQRKEQPVSTSRAADDSNRISVATIAATKVHKRFVRHTLAGGSPAAASPEPAAKRLKTAQQLPPQQQDQAPQLCRSVRLQAKQLQRQEQEREQSAAPADHTAAAAAGPTCPAAAAVTEATTVQEAIKQLRASLPGTNKHKGQQQQQHDDAQAIKVAVAAAKQLHALALQGIHNQKAIAGSGGLSLLLKLLNSSAPDAQMAAAAALEVLALEEKYAFIIIKGAGRLVELLDVADEGEQSDDNGPQSAAVIQHAAAVLYSLLEATGAAPIIAAAGGLDKLLQVLQSVLAGLESTSSSGRWDLGSSGGGSSSNKLSVLDPVLGCLRHMAYPGEPDDVTRAICNAGGVELFMRAVVGSTATVMHLSQQQQDDDEHAAAAAAGSSAEDFEQIKKLQLVQEHALGALWNIARVPELQPKIHAAAVSAANGVKLHGYKMCVQCLCSTSAKVQYEACGVLQWLAVGTAVCRTTVPAAGAIEPLINILAAAGTQEAAAAAAGSSDHDNSSSSPDDYQMELKGNAAGVLWHLADGMKNNQIAIAARGAVPHLVRMLSTGSSGGSNSSSMETMQREAAGALRALAVNLPANKDSIAKAGGITQLLQLLSSSSNTYVQAMAAAALSEVVRGQPANQAAAAAAGAVKILKSLARSSDESLASSVKSALALFSRN